MAASTSPPGEFEIDRQFVDVRTEELDELLGVARDILVDRAVDHDAGDAVLRVEVIDACECPRRSARLRVRRRAEMRGRGS